VEGGMMTLDGGNDTGGAYAVAKKGGGIKLGSPRGFSEYDEEEKDAGIGKEEEEKGGSVGVGLE
jgi:hypothetical protein